MRLKTINIHSFLPFGIASSLGEHERAAAALRPGPSGSSGRKQPVGGCGGGGEGVEAERRANSRPTTREMSWRSKLRAEGGGN